MVQPTQYAPAATAGGQQIGAPQNSQPVSCPGVLILLIRLSICTRGLLDFLTFLHQPSCLNCATSTTPLWRRDESGSVLCNACGLFLKLHGRPRPISLKTDVIKSRNRVKTGAPRKRDSADGHFQSQSQGYLQPQLTVDGAALIPPHPHTYDPQLSSGENIAPPHIFDSLTSDHFGLRQPSPSGSSVNGNNPHLEPPPSYDALQTQNVQLRTRVNELEVIQQLFQGRVEELERGEREAKEAERIKTEEAERVKSDLDTLIARSAELQRRLDELDASGSPARKRARMATVEEPPEEPDVDVS